MRRIAERFHGGTVPSDSGLAVRTSAGVVIRDGGFSTPRIDTLARLSVCNICLYPVHERDRHSFSSH